MADIPKHWAGDVIKLWKVEVTFNKCSLCYIWFVYCSLFLRPESDSTKALHDQVDTLEKHLR